MTDRHDGDALGGCRVEPRVHGALARPTVRGGRHAVVLGAGRTGARPARRRRVRAPRDRRNASATRGGARRRRRRHGAAADGPRRGRALGVAGGDAAHRRSPAAGRGVGCSPPSTWAWVLARSIARPSTCCGSARIRPPATTVASCSATTCSGSSPTCASSTRGCSSAVDDEQEACIVCSDEGRLGEVVGSEDDDATGAHRVRDRDGEHPAGRAGPARRPRARPRRHRDLRGRRVTRLPLPLHRGRRARLGSAARRSARVGGGQGARPATPFADATLVGSGRRAGRDRRGDGRSRFEAGGRLFAFGNGGSSTDAAGVVVAVLAAAVGTPAARPARWWPTTPCSPPSPTTSATSSCSPASSSPRPDPADIAARPVHQRGLGEPAPGLRRGATQGPAHGRSGRLRRRQHGGRRDGRPLPGGALRQRAPHPGDPERRGVRPVGARAAPA